MANATAHAKLTTLTDDESTASPRTELDSHANMCVLGKHAFIFEETGKTCNVTPFDPNMGSQPNIPMVDGALAYGCPYTGRTYILIIRNALHMPSLDYNLIPPFIMRQGGVLLSDVPKIHCEDPTVNDHCIRFEESSLRIPLQLNGIFSYFHTRKPEVNELYQYKKLFLTPDQSDWNPHCPSFERNERSMLDFEGNMADKSRRMCHPDLFTDQDNIPIDLAAVTMDQWEAQIDVNISSAFSALNIEPGSDHDIDFADSINLRGEISKVSASLGSSKYDFDSGNDLFSKDLLNLDQPVTGTWNDLEEYITATFPEEAPAIEVAAVNASKAEGVSAELLSKLWMVSEDLAQGAIDQNTQLCRHSAENHLSRNFSTNDRMLRYKRLNSVFFSDTMFALKHKSVRQYKCCQVFVSDKGYIAVYPMKSQEEFQTALHWFCKQVGVPTDLIVDAHRSQYNPTVKKLCHQLGTTLKVLEKHTPWANRAELYIGILKEAVRRDMRNSNSPLSLWCYCIERRSRIHNAVPRPLFQNQGKSPHAATFGTEGDISNICNFGWYQWIYYRDTGSFPEAHEKLGRCLGPTINEGNEMAQAILTSKGTIVPRRTLRRLRRDELTSETEKKKREVFDGIIFKKLGNSMMEPKNPEYPDHVPYADDSEDPPTQLPDDEDPLDKDGTSQFEKPISDLWINAELNLPQGEELKKARVISRATDDDGNVIGEYDTNPMLNTLIYNVEFSDGNVREYAANVIAENMYTQVDDNGHTYQLLDSILDYKKTEAAVSKEDGYIYTKSGQRRLRMSTAGWKLLIQWKNGSQEWIPLKVMKESNPLEVAEFAVANGIADEPAFHFWVPFTLRRRDRIIAGVNSRVTKTSHKYGIEVPKSIKEAMDLDDLNKNTLWRDALEKEMKNVKVAFDILDRGAKAPPGYSPASGHIVFDVRMTLERKARWVKDGHKTPEPEWSTFAGVVSRESVRIALTYAALNDLSVCACDIQNAYLQAPASEKHYIICGPEFGEENIGKTAIIRRALYGGKSAGADYWRHVRAAMEEMGFSSCKADPDVWFRPSIKSNGTPYYQYVLLYTDDVLAIMESPERFIRDELASCFVVKEKSIEPPKTYLGNKVSLVQLENGVKCWAFSSSQYVQSACRNVDAYRQRLGLKPLPNAKTPWPSNYRPEIDVTPELPPHLASYYQSLIGILRWIVELGRADLVMETSAMASMMAAPRRGHLEVLFQMLSFFKSRHNGVMIFDPTPPEIDRSQFPKEDWSATPYGECHEDIPANAPEPRGIGFEMRAFVDSDHAGDLTTRRSRTGFFIFLNSAPIYWFSKKQGSCETSSFGSEFIAMKSCCEYIRGLRYKLRMMGIPVSDPTFVFGDNQSVLTNSSKPHSQLKKKSSSIAYHFVREGVARDEWRVTYLNTHYNPADIATKSLPSGEKRSRFTAYFLHYME